jgi:hypothetical protein
MKSDPHGQVLSGLLFDSLFKVKAQGPGGACLIEDAWLFKLMVPRGGIEPPTP